MKKSIIIESLTLINFKGIKNQTIKFYDITNIFGANATGKTTIFDAFTWCLFGKDSTDRKDFELKTIDISGKVIAEIDHEVIAEINVNGTLHQVRRVLRENWVKKRGGDEREFQGNVTNYYWNGVPMQQKEFQVKVSEILEEGIFKLITNPLALNSMKWQDRRNILTAMAPISDEELANGKEAFEKLLKDAAAYGSLVDYKKMIKESIKKAKEDVKLIPSRIDEVQRQKPESLDFVKIKSSLDLKTNEYNEIDAQISSSENATSALVSKRRNESVKIGDLENEISTIERNTKIEVEKPVDDSELTKLTNYLQTKESELETAENAIQTLTNSKKSKDDSILELDGKMKTKRSEWELENAKELVIDDDDCKCPTCQRDLDSDVIEEKKSQMLANFNSSKSQRLSEINQQGLNLKNEKESTQKESDSFKDRIEIGQKKIKELKIEIDNLKDAIKLYNSNVSSEPKDTEAIYAQLLKDNQSYQLKVSELAKLKESLTVIPDVNNSELVSKRKEIQDEIDNLKGQLNLKNQIESCNARILELENQQKELNQQIANVEKIEMSIEKFNKLKCDTLEAEINKRFKFVKFRMFETQINGGEVECCDCLIDGVPFTDANTASKINAGIDIINTLCDFYQVTAPIFIDNRESIVELIDCNSQIVNLIVSGEDKKLRVA